MDKTNKQLSLKNHLPIAIFSAFLLCIAVDIYNNNKTITAQEYATDKTDYMKDWTQKELLRELDSLSFVHKLESNDIPANEWMQNEWVPYINNKNHLYNELMKESLPYIQDFMKKNNIKSRGDILNFSNNFVYQTPEEQEKLYNGNTYCKTPRQTLIEKTGDCDDLSLVYYTMFTILWEEVIIVLEPWHAFLLITPTALENKWNTYKRHIKLNKETWKVVWYEVNESIWSNLYMTHKMGDISIKKNENAGIYSIFETTRNIKGIIAGNDTTKRDYLFSNEELIK